MTRSTAELGRVEGEHLERVLQETELLKCEEVSERSKRRTVLGMPFASNSVCLKQEQGQLDTMKDLYKQYEDREDRRTWVMRLKNYAARPISLRDINTNFSHTARH